MKKFKKKMQDRGVEDDAADDPALAESPDPGANERKPSVTNKVTSFLWVAFWVSQSCKKIPDADSRCSKDGIQSGLNMGKSEISDAKKSLQKTVGLGHKPNVVPDGVGSINGEPRTVEIGWHPVAGSAGKWFADSIIGSKIQERTHNYPGMVFSGQLTHST